MTQFTLTQLNLGKSLDSIANIDPRGYGVCNLLYEGSYNLIKEPLAMSSAKRLLQTVKKGDVVYILTGFVLRPFNKAETDGLIGSMMLVRAMYIAFGIKPVIVCPEEAVKAVKNISKLINLKCYSDLDKFLSCDKSLAVVTFTKNRDLAFEQADFLIEKIFPKAVISVECPGANELLVYHNATGLDVSSLEAKQDVLFEKLQQKGVFNIAIGDLGNEIGMGAISSTLDGKIPYASVGSCRCGCGGGIKAKTKADNLITATLSDWGAYALIASLAYLVRDVSVMHDENLEKRAVKVGVKSGLIDMYGESIPKIEGVGFEINLPVVKLMRELVKSTLKSEEVTKTWFEKVIRLNDN